MQPVSSMPSQMQTIFSYSINLLHYLLQILGPEALKLKTWFQWNIKCT